MFMYLCYLREYELKDNFSKSESMIIGRFSLLVINCKTFSSSIYCLTNLELLVPDCSSCKVLQCSRLFEYYSSDFKGYLAHFLSPSPSSKKSISKKIPYISRYRTFWLCLKNSYMSRNVNPPKSFLFFGKQKL